MYIQAHIIVGVYLAAAILARPYHRLPFLQIYHTRQYFTGFEVQISRKKVHLKSNQTKQSRHSKSSSQSVTLSLVMLPTACMRRIVSRQDG